MPSASFTRMASEEVSTKRNPGMSGGKIGAPVDHLFGLMAVPIMPVTPDIAEKYRIDSPRETFVTYIQGQPDVIEGDVMVFDGVDLRVRAVGEWPTDRAYLEVILERVKGA